MWSQDVINDKRRGASPNYEAASEPRNDSHLPKSIAATIRASPYQVNNVLGFPFVFRGALDVRARAIDEEMKLAATHALAALAREEVPDSVCQAYGVEKIQFGPEYIIPKPFDPRALVWVASAVARAAMESGMARQPVDLEEYRERLGTQLMLSSASSRSLHGERGTASPLH